MKVSILLLLYILSLFMQEMDFKHKIIQWNCRGLKPKFDEISLLFLQHNPSVFCLQETFLKPDDKVTLKGFNIYNHIHSECQRPSGGSSVFVKSSCPHRYIELNTELQATAVSVSLNKEITICSVYIPPSFSLKYEHLIALIQQLPAPYLLLGDFNGHNILWGNKENNARGELIENVITNNDICLMNDKSYTYMHYPTGSFFSIDLSLCHPSLFLDFNWSICKDQHHSDHFPIFIESNYSTVEDHSPKWKLNKANWEVFQSLCTDTLTLENFKDSSDPISDFTSSLIDISTKCIPKTSTNPTKSNPWYNDECKEAIKTRKKALNKLKKYPTKDNLNEVKVFRANARRTIKISKRKSWRSYVSKINHKTPIKKVWDMIRKISGKTKSPSYTHLNHPVAETKSTSKFDIAETLGETFLNNSCSRNYSEKFQKVKAEQEKIKLNFKSANTEEYNNLFNFDELLDAIKQSHDSATGPDEVHYQMLKHLPEISLQALLGIFNHIWTTGDFPEDWRLATVIPIPKPGKDPAEPTNYRPIALTSCLCKKLERMINKRLIWYLESNNLLSRYQSGFRAGRSTNDNLVRLETFIRDAFVKKEHVVAVFFDLEKAYDTTWRYGIMKDIHKLGLRGRLPTFIESFLADRAMQVRVGSTLSDLYDQEQGVPQGGVLSTTLFNIKINDIVKCLDNLTDCSLYVDDFCICFRSKSMRTIVRHLQQNLNKIEHWANNNGFKFSKSKTQCVHFCQLRKQHDDPVLTLYGSPIPVVQEYKYLGLIFDKKLSFIPHIKYLKAKCLKSLNILKVLSHTTWGADRTTLLQLYRSLIRSKLDYGSIVYGSARKSYLAMLDPIHHQGLRLALGAFRTSPTASLYVEADEPSLNTRREKLSLQYAIRIAENNSNPAHDVTFQPKYTDLYESKPNFIKSFGVRTLPVLKSAGINFKNIDKTFTPNVPAWCINKPKLLFDLHSGKKSETSSIIMKSNFQELKSHYMDYKHIYTDGSKDDMKVGCAVISDDFSETMRIPDGSSIFTAEAKAVDLALDFIADCETSNKFVIFSDSLSVLKSLDHTSSKNPQIQKLLEKHHDLSEFNEIVYCWIPSHIGIAGNESVDQKAKDSLNLHPTNFSIPYANFKSFINRYILDKWQILWNNSVGNKLFEIKPVLGQSQPVVRNVRQEEVVLARLRIGHTRITHSYLLKREEPPYCFGCDTFFTVRHFLLECGDFSHIRNKYFHVDTIRQLFNDVPIDNVFLFLKEINLFNKL